MTTKMATATSLKVGNFIILGGAACKVVGLEVSRPGKHGHAKVKISAVGLVDEKKRVVVMPGHDNVDVPIIDKRTAQVLSVHGGSANVMDSETYETFDMEIPDEFKDEISEGSTALYWTILEKKVIKQVK